MKFDKELSDQYLRAAMVDSGFEPDVEAQAVLVGTMYTHGEGNDFDYVVLVPDVSKAWYHYEIAGYKKTGADSGEEDDFYTFRKADVNIMLTADLDFFLNFGRAAEVTKYVNSLLTGGHPLDRGQLTKEERIRIHRIIMNGETS